MMNSSLIETVACIYRSAIGPENNWSEALDRTAHEMGAVSGSLHLVDSQRTEIGVTGVSSLYANLSHERVRYWVETYGKSDLPSYRALHLKREIGFYSDMELLGFDNEAQHAEHPSIKYAVEYFGTRHRAGTRLNLHDAWLDMLAVQYAAARGPMTPKEAAIGLLITPHMAKSVELHRAFVMLRQRYNAVIAALDRWQMGICIVVEDGSLVVTNRHADEILAGGDGITRDNTGRLACMDADSDGILRDALARASATACGVDDKAESLIAVGRTSGRDAYLVSVAPLGDDGHELEPGFRGALVAIIDPSRKATISTAGMGEIYKLTKSEQAVCQLLAEGCKTDSIAEIRNLQFETVRSYVKSILAKTRTHGRPDLVRLAMLLNPPIEEPSDR